eukprot:scaffold354960_cov37-Prasinocladus_malaysianus.AAC.1
MAEEKSQHHARGRIRMFDGKSKHFFFLLLKSDKCDKFGNLTAIHEHTYDTNGQTYGNNISKHGFVKSGHVNKTMFDKFKIMQAKTTGYLVTM